MHASPLRVIVIGGVAGGMSAATRLRRLNETALITVLERGPYVSFANCGLPYHLSGTVGRDDLLLHTPDSLQTRFNLDVRVHHEALQIDRAARTVTGRQTLTGEPFTLPYDRLILSPGAHAVRPPIPGIERAFPLRTVPDLDRLKAAVDTAGPHVVVIGAGFIGVEAAENLRAAGRHVTLLEAGPQVLPPLDPELAALVHQELDRQGVHVATGAAVTRVTDTHVHLHSGACLPADVVVLAAGVRPSDQLARDAGLDVATGGGILVNDHLQTSDPLIYAVGDAILTRDALDQPAFVPLAWGANRQGRVAADHLMGRPASYGPHPATAIARIFTLTAGSTGLNERQVRAAGLTPTVIHTHPASHAGYYPGAQGLHLKLVFDAATGRIYGAQAVGGDGTDKRLDVLATALHAGVRADDLADLPLAYAPPYGSAKDPVNMLGYVAQNVMDGLTRPLQWHEALSSGRQLIDVRSADEYRRGHLPGAVNIPLDTLREQAPHLAPRVLVYCQVGQRGHTAALLLNQLGVDACTLSGGYLTWQAGQASLTPAAHP